MNSCCPRANCCRSSSASDKNQYVQQVGRASPAVLVASARKSSGSARPTSASRVPWPRRPAATLLHIHFVKGHKPAPPGTIRNQTERNGTKRNQTERNGTIWNRWERFDTQPCSLMALPSRHLRRRVGRSPGVSPLSATRAHIHAEPSADCADERREVRSPLVVKTGRAEPARTMLHIWATEQGMCARPASVPCWASFCARPK